jgi:hypothetical protein
MNDGKSESSVSAIVSLLKSSMSADGSQSFGYLAIYTSFGVVRGRTSFSFGQSLNNPEGEVSASESDVTNEIIELHNVSVEHYSNHLPTASFERLYVKLSDIHGFAILDA